MIPTVKRRTIVTTSALIVGFTVLAFVKASWVPPGDPPPLPNSLPTQLSDAEFWQIVENFSEPSGYFQSDNFLSNESGLQDVIPDLRARIKPGGVYLGVGPEQNFTYIQALEPKMAFVLDIRRLNALEHLLYKALFELSATRVEFLS